MLGAAGGVVSHNIKRSGKNLVATKAAGRALKFFEARDATAEAEYVAEAIRALLPEDSAQHAAVFYRTNAQSRPFQEVFRRVGLRDRLIGWLSCSQLAAAEDRLA